MAEISNLQSAYALALEKAMERLAELKLDSVSRITGTSLSDDGEKIRVRYMSQDCFVNPVKRTVTAADFEQGMPELSITEQVLILHYLTRPGQFLPLEERQVSFKEIPEAQIYNAAFEKRVLNPMVKWFAGNLEGFQAAGEKLGARTETYGHASHTLQIFPMVPVTYVLWQGDEEVPSSGTVLFDSSVAHYLSAEDIVFAASYGVYAHRK